MRDVNVHLFAYKPDQVHGDVESPDCMQFTAAELQNLDQFDEKLVFGSCASLALPL